MVRRGREAPCGSRVPRAGDRGVDGLETLGEFRADVRREGGPFVDLAGLRAVLAEEDEHPAFGFAFALDPRLVASPAWWEIVRPGSVHEDLAYAAVRQPGADGAAVRKVVVERDEDIVGDGDPAVVLGSMAISRRWISISIGALVQVLDG